MAEIHQLAEAIHPRYRATVYALGLPPLGPFCPSRPTGNGGRFEALDAAGSVIAAVDLQTWTYICR